MLSALRTLQLSSRIDYGLMCRAGASRETSNLKIALIEGQDLKRSQLPASGYSNRCSSLTPGSVKFLSGMRDELHERQGHR